MLVDLPFSWFDCLIFVFCWYGMWLMVGEIAISMVAIASMVNLAMAVRSQLMMLPSSFLSELIWVGKANMLSEGM